MVFSVLTFGQSGNSFTHFGMDYRQYPIDIENVPEGPYHSNGSPSDMKFWKVFSIHGAYGLRLEKNWNMSLCINARYNHLHWRQGYNYVNPPRDRKERKNFKCDVFLDFEKKVRLKKNKEQFFFGIAGIGVTNINTKFDISLQDTLSTGPIAVKHYEGTYAHLSPRISLGYQHKKIKGSLDAYIIEGPDLTNLTSLWLGATLSYEINLKKIKTHDRETK
jgi:hypothetical protein